MKHIYITILTIFLLSACNDAIAKRSADTPTALPTLTLTSTSTMTPTDTSTPTDTPTSTATNTATRTPTNTPSLTHTPTFTPTPTESSIPIETATITPTPAPITYPGLTIQELSERSYGGGQIEIIETLVDRKGYTRYLFTYPSDGLTIYGYMDLPKGDGAFPVAMVVHGQLPPELYNTQTYTRRYTAPLAEAGYLVLHPNMRGFYPSDDGPDWFRIGVATDVLNLLGILKAEAGQPGPLEKANPEFIGLMGHSMGGGAALRVSVIDPDIDATVLYASMSGNERWNYERMLRWSGGTFGHRELSTPDSYLEQVSPIFHLERIAGPVSLHNGESDGTTLDWGIDLCDRLKAIEKPVECFTYPGQPHIFEGEGDLLFTKRLIEFFDRVRTAQIMK
jgi:dienelactone hydrolase